MGIHVAITAREEFITQLLSLEDNIHAHITRLTIVESPDANRENFDDLSVIEMFDYDYKKFGNVNWDTVDLYLYNDSLENLKYLTGAAAKSVLSVDLSGYSATLDQMPVVIPRLDEAQLEEVKEKKMVSLPHPQVSQLIYLLDHLRLHQPFLYVSVNNLFSVSYLQEMDSCKELATETRNYFNFEASDKDVLMAFNLNALQDLAPEKSINFEAQIHRLAPQLDTVMVQNVVTPVFFGTTQMVTVGMTNGNTVDQGVIDEWLEKVKHFNGILYKETGISPRNFVSLEHSNKEALLEFGNVSTADKIKWISVTDNQQMVIKQTIELINLFVAEQILPHT